MAEKAMMNGTSALRVITIEAAERPQAMKLRVAAYARVSSPSEDQKHSYYNIFTVQSTAASGGRNRIVAKAGRMREQRPDESLQGPGVRTKVRQPASRCQRSIDADRITIPVCSSQQIDRIGKDERLDAECKSVDRSVRQ